MVRRLVVSLLALRLLREETLLIDGIDIGIVEVVILACNHQVQIGIGSTEALHQFIEQAHLRFRCNQVGHIGQRRNNILHTVNETIRATDVRLLHLHAVYAGITSLTMCLVVVDEVVVLVGDALVGQLLLNELHQGHRCLVVHTHHVVAAFTVTCPIGIVGHFLGFQHTHRVVDGARGIAAHALTLTRRRTLDIRETVQLNRVVNHAAIEQQLLL